MRATSLQLLPPVLPVLRGECDHCPDMRPKHAKMVCDSTNQQSLELQICNYSIAEKPKAERSKCSLVRQTRSLSV